MLRTNPAAFLLSGAITSGGGTLRDTRATTNYGYLEYATYSPSAVLGFEISRDGTAWLRERTVTGTPTTATAQVVGYFPYVRGVYVTGWSTTASANMFYAPGLV